MVSAFKREDLGNWLKKPMEQDQFMVPEWLVKRGKNKQLQSDENKVTQQQMKMELVTGNPNKNNFGFDISVE